MQHENGQPEALKRQNRNLIMSLIENEPYLSRAALARRTGLSRTTVSQIMRELLQARLVRELEDTTPTGGRPATQLILDTEGWYALGAELRSREWVFVLLDTAARVIQKVEIPVSLTSPQEAIRILCEGLYKMRQGVPGRLLPAVGIGVPGLVDINTGTIKRADDLGWLEVPIRERVQASCGIPAYVMNRHRASGLAEARYGAGAGVTELIYLGIGTGISAAIFVKGELLEGVNSSSGEVGHMTVLPDGPLCRCGNRGCLQVLASGPAIVEDAVRRFTAGQPTGLGKSPEEIKGLTGEAICEAAKAGDELALACLEQAATYLGIAIANLINAINPATIVIGGPIGQTGEPLLGLIRAEVRRRAMSYPLSAVQIIPSSLGRNAGAIGAATLVLNRKLQLIFDNQRSTSK